MAVPLPTLFWGLRAREQDKGRQAPALIPRDELMDGAMCVLANCQKNAACSFLLANGYTCIPRLDQLFQCGHSDPLAKVMWPGVGHMTDPEKKQVFSKIQGWLQRNKHTPLHTTWPEIWYTTPVELALAGAVAGAGVEAGKGKEKETILGVVRDPATVELVLARAGAGAGVEGGERMGEQKEKRKEEVLDMMHDPATVLPDAPTIPAFETEAPRVGGNGLLDVMYDEAEADSERTTANRPIPAKDTTEKKEDSKYSEDEEADAKKEREDEPQATRSTLGAPIEQVGSMQTHVYDDLLAKVTQQMQEFGLDVPNFC